MSLHPEPSDHDTFYSLEESSRGHSTVGSTRHTAGPWSPDAQHGGPPMALLAREAARLAGEDRTVARVTCDLLGPVPVGRLRVTAEVVRPGRAVELVESRLTDLDSGRDVARASSWLLPRTEDGPRTGEPTPPAGPAHGEVHAVPPGWHRGYLDAIEWRWVEGSLEEPGPATVWMRPRLALVPGEDLSPLQRLLVCVDSASGASAALPIGQWQFMNTELTAHLVREPSGDWVGLRALTTISGGSVGLARAEVFDERGFVGHSAQSLLVRRAPQPTT